MNVVKEIQRINQREAGRGTSLSASWHADYDSAYVFVANLDYELTEGDVICIFSQYGEIVDVNLIRDQKTGKSRGFGFVCYEDQRSTVLAVDNFNGTKIRGRTIRCDHVKDYRPPKDEEHREDVRPEVSVLHRPEPERNLPSTNAPPKPMALLDGTEEDPMKEYFEELEREKAARKLRKKEKKEAKQEKKKEKETKKNKEEEKNESNEKEGTEEKSKDSDSAGSSRKRRHSASSSDERTSSDQPHHHHDQHHHRDDHHYQSHEHHRQSHEHHRQSHEHHPDDHHHRDRDDHHHRDRDDRHHHHH